MRVIDDETIWVPNRQAEIKKVPKIYERICGTENQFRLKLHPELYIVRTWYGLGDTIYQIPFIRELKEKHGDKLVLKTSWPELFENIKVTKPSHRLHVQSINVTINTDRYVDLQNRVNMKLGYLTEDLKRMSMLEGIEKNTFKLKSFDMDLKIKPEWQKKVDELNLPKNTILMYLPTIRTDWFCPERNPNPDYFQKIIDTFPEYHYVAFGYIREGIEAYVKEIKGINYYMDKGELHYTTILALLKMFPSVIRPSFTVPAAIAVGAKSLCLYGGHFPPSVLTDSRMNLTNFKQVAPKPFTNWLHKEVNKKLDVEEVLENFRSLTHGT